MKKIITYILVITIISGLIIGGKKLIASKKAQDDSVKTAKSYALVVKAVGVKESKATLTLPYLAITKSNDDVKISSKVSARINFITKNGIKVKKGDIVVRLDDSDLQTKLIALKLNINSLNSQLKSKKLALNNLLQTHTRTKKLLAVRGASKEQFDKESTNIEATKAGIETTEFKRQELYANITSIKNLLSYTKIKAPVDGVLTSMSSIGDVAMPGKPLVSISAKSNSYLLVTLPSTINAKSIIYKNKKYQISALNTTNNGLLEYLANIDQSLASNQKVNIDVVIFDAKGYKLSSDSILNRDGKNFVLTVKGDRAVPKEVKIIANGEQGVVVSGVNTKDRVVVAKQDILLKLLSGIKITTN